MNPTVVCIALGGPYDGINFPLFSPATTVWLLANLIKDSPNGEEIVYNWATSGTPIEGYVQYWLHDVETWGVQKVHVYKDFPPPEPLSFLPPSTYNPSQPETY